MYWYRASCHIGCLGRIAEEENHLCDLIGRCDTTQGALAEKITVLLSVPCQKGSIDHAWLNANNTDTSIPDVLGCTPRHGSHHITTVSRCGG